MGLKFARGADQVLYTLQRHYEVGPTLSASRYALEFGNKSGYLRVDNGPTTSLDTGAFTWEFWIYPRSYTAGAFMNKNHGNASPWHARYLYFENGTNGRLVYNYYNGYSSTVTTTSTVPLDTWTHVALAHDINGVRIYFNGILAGSGGAGAPGTGQYSGKGFFIGGGYNQPSPEASGPTLDGRMDEVRVWDHARSQSEIFAMKDRTVRAAAGLQFSLTCDPEGFIINTAGTDLTLENFGTVVVQENGLYLKE